MEHLEKIKRSKDKICLKCKTMAGWVYITQLCVKSGVTYYDKNYYCAKHRPGA